MSIRVIKNDIVRVAKDINADIVVDTANPYPVIGGGTDSAIYKAAGEDKLLKERLKVGNIEPGDARITSGCDLCKYIIHTVGPNYIDGNHNEEQILRNCYRNTLQLAKENHCKSIVFPIISTGTYGYPKAEAISIEVSEINDFLIKYGSKMEVTIAAFSKDTFFMLDKILDNTESVISDEEIEELKEIEYNYHLKNERMSRERELISESKSNLDISDDTKTFSDMLWYYRNIRNEEFPVIYKRAHIDKRQFNKYVNDVRPPSKKDAIKICIGLKLTYNQSVDLLSRASHAFNPSNEEDLEIIHGIKKGWTYDQIKSSLNNKNMHFLDE